MLGATSFHWPLYGLQCLLFGLGAVRCSILAPGSLVRGGVGRCIGVFPGGQGPLLGTRCWQVVCLFPGVLRLSESAIGGLGELILGRVAMLVGMACGVDVSVGLSGWVVL